MKNNRYPMLITCAIYWYLFVCICWGFVIVIIGRFIDWSWHYGSGPAGCVVMGRLWLLCSFYGWVVVVWCLGDLCWLVDNVGEEWVVVQSWGIVKDGGLAVFSPNKYSVAYQNKGGVVVRWWGGGERFCLTWYQSDDLLFGNWFANAAGFGIAKFQWKTYN